MEFGLYTFGDLPLGTRGPEASRQRLSEIVAAAKLADEAGLAVFGIGEHHRPDYAISSPEVVLGALANATRSIALTTAVTILSSNDPVRLFEQFATTDLLSDGRAEITVGRGAFIESFPLFGYDLNDYEALYDEKLDLFLKIAQSECITWDGRFRSALREAVIAPRPLPSAQSKIWIGAGGTPASAVRAGRAGLPLNLANIGSPPQRFKPFIDLYRQSWLEAGHEAGAEKVAISAHFHVQKDSQDARNEFYPYYARYIGHNLPAGDDGWKVSRDDYERLRAPHGPLFVGSPQQIIDKVLYEHELFGHDRFMAQLDIGGLPYPKVADAIELLATEVMPAVNKALSQPKP
ncbi:MULTISPECIES: LLM class flavin-dependent oxidoreductase [unclassified Rhizobium]|uniref:LLM class flavin-dependent oxidoreductase n=1 Tax=unclassified Rhizobium TaxID=2613769 RepID=UPI001AD97D90|nr:MULTISPECIES: LLM class flavin-dependent oxidoreductase [unclassified Rhizobium]MBO9123715.1 LLM class flavin-dependent oxidoreductase [Rhizobium sp. 16-488-2b]MBO9174247.1 LLM class flavin-dependent oxidoreductase [Rhizobium sp. 16-488-2a]